MRHCWPDVFPIQSPNTRIHQVLFLKKCVFTCLFNHSPSGSNQEKWKTASMMEFIRISHSHIKSLKDNVVYVLRGTIICFSKGRWPETRPGWGRALWGAEWGMHHQMSWPSLSRPDNPTQTHLRWSGISLTTERRRSSQRVLWKMTSWSSLREMCKGVIKAKGVYA